MSQSGDENRDRSHRLIYAIALAAGVAVSLLSWIGGELTRGAFKARHVSTTFYGMTHVGPSPETQNAADLKNSVLAFGILGGVTGLVLGFAGGVGGRAPIRGAIVGAGALALGSTVGVVASMTMLPFYYRRLVPDPNDLLTPILIHGGISAAIGAVGGAPSRSARAVGDSRLRMSEGRAWVPCGHGYFPDQPRIVFPRFQRWRPGRRLAVNPFDLEASGLGPDGARGCVGDWPCIQTDPSRPRQPKVPENVQVQAGVHERRFESGGAEASLREPSLTVSGNRPPRRWSPGYHAGTRPRRYEGGRAPASCRVILEVA